MVVTTMGKDNGIRDEIPGMRLNNETTIGVVRHNSWQRELNALFDLRYSHSGDSAPEVDLLN